MKRPLVDNIAVYQGGKAVVADTINTVIIEGGRPPLIPLDPFATVPPLPLSFIERPELSEPLREKLLSGSATVDLTAIEGMGGVGKTMVALGLCHDEQLRQAFPDGIVWLTIGKESNVPLKGRVRKVRRQQFETG